MIRSTNFIQLDLLWNHIHYQLEINRIIQAKDDITNNYGLNADDRLPYLDTLDLYDAFIRRKQNLPAQNNGRYNIYFGQNSINNTAITDEAKRIYNVTGKNNNKDLFNYFNDRVGPNLGSLNGDDIIQNLFNHLWKQYDKINEFYPAGSTMKSYTLSIRN